MDKKEHIFDEAKKNLNKARRSNKLSIVIWIVFIVVMLVLAVIEGITGHYGSMLNTGGLIILAVYIILLHMSKGKDYIMLDEDMNMIEHIFTSHQEYVESIFAEARAAAEEEEKKKKKQEDEVMPEEIYEIICGAVGARKRAGRMPECVLRLRKRKRKRKSRRTKLCQRRYMR